VSRTPRIYLPESLTPGSSCQLDDVNRHRLLNVLRLKAGTKILLFNGLDDIEASAEITQLDRKHGTVRIHGITNVQRESPLHTIVWQSLSKPERMDLTVQKLVELGVNEIQPVYSAFSQPVLASDRLNKRMAHWQGILIHACEQTGRCHLPVIHPPVTLHEKLEGFGNSQTGIVMDPDAHATIDQTINKNLDQVTVLVGAEGGLSGEEVAQARQKGMKVVRVGPRIFRTETAGAVMLALLQARCGDFR
jgi:16S rRNA (uracil1498-N3)-methyltransferase